MKVKAAFWVSGITASLATVLRCLQLLFFFDDETGFVTDSGVFTYLYCGILLASALVSGLLCRADRDTCGVMQRVRSWGAATTSLLLAIFLFYCAFVLLLEHYSFLNFGITYFLESLHVAAHVPLAVLSALFGIASVVMAVCWVRGGRLPGGLGVLWISGVLWGLYFMVLTFMTYSAVATTQENMFTVGGGALMLLFLLQESKLLSGTGGRKVTQYMFVCGLPAAALWLTYVISNTVLILFGRGYAAEMPYVIQLVMLFLALHALSVLNTLRNRGELASQSGVNRQNIGRSERKETSKSLTNERFN